MSTRVPTGTRSAGGRPGKGRIRKQVDQRSTDAGPWVSGVAQDVRYSKHSEALERLPTAKRIHLSPALVTPTQWGARGANDTPPVHVHTACRHDAHPSCTAPTAPSGSAPASRRSGRAQRDYDRALPIRSYVSTCGAAQTASTLWPSGSRTYAL
jgi:hypothetical protein